MPSLVELLLSVFIYDFGWFVREIFLRQGQRRPILDCWSGRSGICDFSRTSTCRVCSTLHLGCGTLDQGFFNESLRSRSNSNVARQGVRLASGFIPHLPFQQVFTARHVPGEFPHRRGDANPQKAYPWSVCAQPLQAHLELAVHFEGAGTGRQREDASASSLKRSPSGTSICVSS